MPDSTYARWKRIQLPSLAEELDAVLRPPADLFPFDPATDQRLTNQTSASAALPMPPRNPRAERQRRRRGEIKAELARIREQRGGRLGMTSDSHPFDALRIGDELQVYMAWPSVGYKRVGGRREPVTIPPGPAWCRIDNVRERNADGTVYYEVTAVDPVGANVAMVPHHAVMDARHAG